MPRFDVTTFGEGGLRLSVPKGQRIEQASRFDVNIAGAEANVTGALARLALVVRAVAADLRERSAELPGIERVEGWEQSAIAALENLPVVREVASAIRVLPT